VREKDEIEARLSEDVSDLERELLDDKKDACTQLEFILRSAKAEYDLRLRSEGVEKESLEERIANLEQSLEAAAKKNHNLEYNMCISCQHCRRSSTTVVGQTMNFKVH